MMSGVGVTRLSRKALRRLNWYGIFVDLDSSADPMAVLAGYTRSGTTFLGRLLANVTGARPIHEPLNPKQVPTVGFFNERESGSLIETDERYKQAIRTILAPGFKGTRYTNTGSRVIYRGRLIKIVRANHYVGHLSSLLPNTPFIVIIRNPCACIASRIQKGWPVPDHSHSIEDLTPLLTSEQLSIYRSSKSTAKRLAVSWCLDNFSLVRNAGNDKFIFVHYESILSNPEEEMLQILSHIGREDCSSRIKWELQMEGNSYNPESYTSKWKKVLSADQIAEIQEVLTIFNLDEYYDIDSGMPLAARPIL